MTAIITGEGFREELPGLSDMYRLFEIFDDSARGYREAIRGGDLHKAAEFVNVMFRLEVFLQQKCFEA